MFSSQTMIQDLGFPSAWHLRDWHHLFASGLQDLCGKSAYSVIQQELSQMIRARTEDYFDKAHINALSLLQRLGQRSAEAKDTLESFAKARNEYSQFCIDTIPP